MVESMTCKIFGWETVEEARLIAWIARLLTTREVT